jgi:hypothetical protein
MRDEIPRERLLVFVANFRTPSLHLVELSLPLRLGEALLLDHLGRVAGEAMVFGGLSTVAWRKKRDLGPDHRECRERVRTARSGRLRRFGMTSIGTVTADRD